MPNDELHALRVKLALHEHPEAAAFPELVTGNTEDEVMASAASAAERVRAMSGNGNNDPYQQARDLYGPGPSTGGASAPMGFSRQDPDRETIRRENAFAEKFNNAPLDPYGQRIGISP